MQIWSYIFIDHNLLNAYRNWKKSEDDVLTKLYNSVKTAVTKSTNYFIREAVWQIIESFW